MHNKWKEVRSRAHIFNLSWNDTQDWIYNCRFCNLFWRFFCLSKILATQTSKLKICLSIYISICHITTQTARVIYWQWIQLGYPNNNMIIISSHFCWLKPSFLLKMSFWDQNKKYFCFYVNGQVRFLFQWCSRAIMIYTSRTFDFSFPLLQHCLPSNSFNFTFISSPYFVWKRVVILL